MTALFRHLEGNHRDAAVLINLDSRVLQVRAGQDGMVDSFVVIDGVVILGNGAGVGLDLRAAFEVRIAGVDELEHAGFLQRVENFIRVGHARKFRDDAVVARDLEHDFADAQTVGTVLKDLARDLELVRGDDGVFINIRFQQNLHAALEVQAEAEVRSAVQAEEIDLVRHVNVNRRGENQNDEQKIDIGLFHSASVSLCRDRHATGKIILSFALGRMFS